MKLEVARSKMALAAEVELKKDALRLLSESTNANLQMEAKTLKNMVGCQELKRRSRWLTDDMRYPAVYWGLSTKLLKKILT